MKYLQVSIVIVALVLAGCVQTIPKEALKLSPSSLEDRQMQTRVYEDVTEEQILSASVAIIQDLGAQINESETDLGLIVGEKMRDATDAGQVAGAIVLALLTGAATPVDKEQKIKFSLVTAPESMSQNSERWSVRLTIQRKVWNTQNQLSRIEAIKEPEIFQGFFEKLDKSLFLEKQS
ncbi:hypothetical protein [Oceanicoccus sagamiensis]|nr:hypothetical protein [Oceanicoccus sagamiensis]